MTRTSKEKISSVSLDLVIHMLSALANGKLVVCLEGNNMQNISNVLNGCFVKGSNMDQPNDLDVVNSVIRSTVKLYSEFWNCLQFNKKLPKQ